jgi:hypothetical protein
MIILIIITLIPMLVFGYIMYDFLKKKYNKKKDLMRARVELRTLLVRQPSMVDVTHSVEVRLLSSDLGLDGRVITIWCKYVNSVFIAQGSPSLCTWYYDPILDNWHRFDSVLDVIEGLTHRLPARFRGDRNRFRVLNPFTVKIPTMTPTKKFRRHSFTH